MSKTSKTDDARIARKLAKLERMLASKRWRGDATEDDLVIEAAVNKQLDVLHVNGVRYGNHRKWKAREKVTDRRKERRLLNGVKGDTDDQH
jgi:hypothetical protein